MVDDQGCTSSASDRQPVPLADWCPSVCIHPKFAVRSSGCHIADGEGREWIDLHSGWGTIILGYSHPRVIEAVQRQMEIGGGSGVPHRWGHEVTELLLATIPCAEQVVFGKNGSDVTMGAVRLARASTGREKVLFRGYHGFHDWYLAAGPGCKGVPMALRSLIEELAGNDLQRIEEQLKLPAQPVAAIILDVGALPVPNQEFLRSLVELAHRYGALVIFDEIGTGFRVAPGGVQQYFGVTPDLACFSKAIANGFPLSALAGSHEVMNHLPSLRFGMTFAYDPVSMAAAQATITTILEQDVCAALWAKGQALESAFSSYAERCGLHVRLAGMAPRQQIVFEAQGGLQETELRWLFLQELARKKIFATGVHSESEAARHWLDYGKAEGRW